MKNFGERLQQYRYEHIMSQQELADLCKVSKQTIYAIENKLQEPSLLTRAKIEAVIGKENE